MIGNVVAVVVGALLGAAASVGVFAYAFRNTYR